MGAPVPEIVLWILVPLGFIMIIGGIAMLVFRRRVAENMRQANLSPGLFGGYRAYAVGIGVMQVILGLLLSVGLLLISRGS